MVLAFSVNQTQPGSFHGLKKGRRLNGMGAAVQLSKHVQSHNKCFSVFTESFDFLEIDTTSSLYLVNAQCIFWVKSMGDYHIANRKKIVWKNIYSIYKYAHIRKTTSQYSTSVMTGLVYRRRGAGQA
jgi:hypothetical protein